MQTFIYIFLPFVVILAFIALMTFLYWHFKKRYTRERFAFVITTQSSAILFLISPVILGNEHLFNTGVNVINHVLGFKIEHIQDFQFSARALGLVFFGMYLFFCYKIYTNWTGQISNRQHLNEIEKQPESFWSDFLANFQKKSDLNIYTPEETLIKFHFDFPKEENLPWHIKAANLLAISSKQFLINIKNDWHPHENCFISRYNNDEKKICIYCDFQIPSQSRVKKIKDFAEEITSQGVYKYYFLIKNDDDIPDFIKNDHYIVVKTENNLLNDLVDFKDYREFIINQFEKTEIIEGYPYTLNDIFSSPACTLRKRRLNGHNEDVPISDIEDYIQKWLNNDQEKKQLALLGEYGQGKSVLALRICYLIYKGLIETNRIPIIIELRGKYPKQYSDLISFLADWSSKFRLDPEGLLRLHMSGRLLIIFDAFDEMELVGDYTIRIEHFRKIWGFSYPSSKLIITGRPNYFLNDTELKSLLKTAETHTEMPLCEELYIEMFDETRIESSLRSVDQDVKKDILSIYRAANSNSSFVDLISRPALLFLTSIVWKERNLFRYKNNINSAKVIEEFLKQTYQRQSSKTIWTPLTNIERAYFMLGIAVKMVSEDGFTNQISLDRLRHIIDKLSAQFPDEITNYETTHLKETPVSLKKRFEKKYNKETIFNDIRSCGIIVRDMSTFDNYKFAHKSFLEYLVSFFYANLLIDYKTNEVDKIMIRSIKKNLELDLINIKRTPEVFKFITQIVAQRIEIREGASSKEKMNIAFSILHPVKKLSFKTADKLIPLFGRDINKMARLSILYAVLLILVTLIGVSTFGGSKFFSKEVLFDRTVLLVIVSLFIYIYILAIFIDNSLHKKYGGMTKKSKFDLFLAKMFSNIGFANSSESQEIFRVIDTGNFNLWYQTCLEMGVKREEIENSISKRLYTQLENTRQYYNSFQQ